MSRSPNSNFQEGTACYTCRICGKRTRGTGTAGSEAATVWLCQACYDECLNENARADGRAEGDA